MPEIRQVWFLFLANSFVSGDRFHASHICYLNFEGDFFSYVLFLTSLKKRKNSVTFVVFSSSLTHYFQCNLITQNSLNSNWASFSRESRSSHSSSIALARMILTNSLWKVAISEFWCYINFISRTIDPWSDYTDVTWRHMHATSWRHWLFDIGADWVCVDVEDEGRTQAENSITSLYPPLFVMTSFR